MCRVKRLQKEPREDCRLDVERLWRILTADLILLQSLQSNLKNAKLTQTGNIEDLQHDLFEHSDDEIVDDNPSTQDPKDVANDPNDALPPERILVHLPSSHTTTTNQPFQKAELALRIKQATWYLAALRDAIAQKSFQYSHIMQSAPSNAVWTRSQLAILHISDQIAQYSWVYCRAWAAMVRLGADKPMLDKFKLLSREDVKASTAILDPNIAGSSKIHLSWIWETGPKISGLAPEAMWECKPLEAFKDLTLITFLKFSVFIGFRPECKNTDGKKNSCWLNMRWNGPQDHFCTRPKNGRIGLKSRMSIQDQRHMLLGSRLNGDAWHWMQIGFSDRRIWSMQLLSSDVNLIGSCISNHQSKEILIGFGTLICSLTMPRIPITDLFNAYYLQVNPLEEDKIRSQEVVNYCEAWFWIALQAMMVRSDEDQMWMYRTLYREMVFMIRWFSLCSWSYSFRSYVFLTSEWQPRSANLWIFQSLSGHLDRLVLSRDDAEPGVLTRPWIDLLSRWEP